jgi:hypothetical protein
LYQTKHKKAWPWLFIVQAKRYDIKKTANSQKNCGTKKIRHLQCIRHIAVTLCELWFDPDGLFVLGDAHVEVVQLGHMTKFISVPLFDDYKLKRY